MPSSSIPHNSTLSETSRKRKREPDLLKEIGVALQNITNIPDPKKDEWDIFGQFIGNEIKSFHNLRRQTVCKREILKLILEFKDEDENDEEN